MLDGWPDIFLLMMLRFWWKQMDELVDCCIGYLSEQLASVCELQSDITALPNELFTRLAKVRTHLRCDTGLAFALRHRAGICAATQGWRAHACLQV